MTKAVELPDKMVTEIETILTECPEFGYESIDEFVREAVREKFTRGGV